MPGDATASNTPPKGRLEIFSNSRRLWAWMALLTAALAVRLVGLNGCLWYDEVVTLIEFVRLPFSDLIATYSDQNQHPLFSIVARLSILAFGESSWSLRLPAALFGVAGVYAAFRLAREFTSELEAWLVATFIAFSYHHVWFSQNARGYSALFFFATLGSSLFVRALRRPTTSTAVAYGVVMALSLYTHLTAAFVVGAHVLVFAGLWCLSRARGRRISGFWVLPFGFAATGVLALALYAPMLSEVVNAFQGHGESIRVRPWTDPKWGVMQIIGSLHLGASGAIAVVLASSVVLLGAASFWRRDPIVVALLATQVLLGFGVMLLLRRHMYPRFFFPAFTLAVMIVVRGGMVIGSWIADRMSAAGRDVSLRRGWQLAPAALLIGASIATLGACYRAPKQDYSGALEFVENARGDNDRVVATGMAIIPVTQYYRPQVQAIRSVDELQALRKAAGVDSIWLIYSFRNHMDSFHPELLAAIDREFTVVKTFAGTVGEGEVLVCRSGPANAERRLSASR